MKEILQKLLDAIPRFTIDGRLATNEFPDGIGLCNLAHCALSENGRDKFIKFLALDLKFDPRIEHYWFIGHIEPRVQWLKEKIKELEDEENITEST